MAYASSLLPPYSDNYTYSNYTIRLAQSQQKSLEITRQKAINEGVLRTLYGVLTSRTFIKLYTYIRLYLYKYIV